MTPLTLRFQKFALRLGILLSGAFLLLLGWVAPLPGAMDPLSEKSMREVNGRAGIGFTLNNWRIDNSDIELTLDNPSGNQMSVSNIEVYDIDGIENPGWISDDAGPAGDDAGNRLTSGSFTDPFQLNVTGAQGGVIAMDWPDNNANFEAADIGLDLSFQNQYLGRITVGNALWAGGTRIAMKINPDGGIGLGIGIQLNGDAWLRAYDGCCPSFYPARGGVTLEGIYGAGSYTCTLPDTSEGCFDGVLKWANLSQGRPLKVNFSRNDPLGSRKIVLERCATWNAGCGAQENAGAIGINSLEFVGPTYSQNRTDLGSTVVGRIEIRHFRIVAPVSNCDQC